ncbi:MAG: pentapeptide repeat-containing protein [Candidatus Aminicenantes bacterium]|nr:pentapeptide repeat-containing protein [Candidatus Aminicenantes bacterium]
MSNATLFSTFYSFKGGVGRSLTLVNTAVELTRQGHSVFIWDMDIEAPGIQHIPYFEKMTDDIKGGVVDITADFLENECREMNEDKFHDFIVTHPDNAKLRLLPAGNLIDDSEYARKFASIQWEQLFGADKTGGVLLFESMRQAILSYHPDFVLIDSRTGFTDIGGLCCFTLPDVVFLVFTYGSQNMKGLRGIHNALTDTDWLKQLRADRPLKTYLIASMIPTDRPDLRKNRKTQWQKNHAPGFTFNVHAEIPFNVEMAFNETVWPAEYPDHEFCQHYEKIAGLLLAERDQLTPAENDTLLEEKVISRQERSERGERSPRQVSPDEQFELDTAHLFRLMGYEAEVNKSITGSQIDIFLSLKTPIETQEYIVECKYWEKNVDKKVVDEVENNMKSVHKQYPGCRAIIVAKKGFTREAKSYAESLHMTMKTYEELLNGIINFDRYISYVKTLYAGTALEKNYIPQDVLVENRGKAEPLLNYMNRWSTEPGGGFFTLLGDFGTGKTSFTKRLAHDYALLYEKDRTGGRIPVLINLKDVHKTLSLENIIFEHFTRTANMNVAPEAFLHLLKEGKILLIFDGFDEMATQSNASLTMKNFLELNRAFGGKGKILLTCRTHYFKDRVETEDTLKARKKGMTEPATELYRAIQGKQGYTIGYLQEFGKEQTRAYLEKTLPETWQEAQGFIERVYNLKDLASRPVLLDMIVKSLPAIKQKQGDIQVADLYSAYVQSWIDINDWRHELTREGRELLVEEIAVRLWEQETDRVHYSQMNDLLKDYLKEKKPLISITDVEFASSEVRTASFLTRDDAGNYGFAHRSFLEYFLARRIAGRLRNNDIKCLNIKRLSKEVILFLGRMAGLEDLVKICGETLSHPYSKKISENALSCFYWGIRYMHSADGTIKKIQLLKELFARYKPSAILLQGAELEGAELAWMDLSGAQLEKANMKAAILTGVLLVNSNLNEAELSFALLDEACLSGARVCRATAHHVSFKKAVLNYADFSDCDLHACNFLDADMEKALFTGSDLSYAGFMRAFTDFEPQFTTAQSYAAGMLGTQPSELQPTVQIGHGSNVYFANFSPNGRLMVSASKDHTIKIWDAEIGREIKTLKGHSASVNSAAFSPDGRFIVSASLDQTIKIWDAELGREIKTFKGHSVSVNSAAFSPNGKFIVSASSDNSIKLWDAENGREIRTLKGHTASVFSVAFSPNGASIVSASYDRTIKIWDVETGREIRSLEGHTNVVNSAAFSPNGLTIVSASADNTIKIWDADTGKETRTLTGHAWGASSAFFSPNGKSIVSQSSAHTIKLWDVETLKEIRTLKGYSNWVYSATFSSNGRLIVSASSDHTLKLWDVETGRETKTLKGHSKTVRSAVFSPNGLSIVSASDDNTIKIWDAETGSENRTFKGHSDTILFAAFSPNGLSIVSASDDNTIKIWDAETGRLIRTLSGHSQAVNSAAFSLDGISIVSASADSTIKIWDAETGRAIKNLKGHSNWVNSTSFSPNGISIVSASSDNTIKIWDAETGKKTRTLTGHSNFVNSAAFSPDGRLIVSAGEDHTVKLWDAETGKEIVSLENIARPFSAAFNPAGDRICIGTSDGILLAAITYKDKGKGKGKEIKGLEIMGAFYHLPGHEWAAVGADNRFACSEGGRAFLYFADRLALYPASDLPELESPAGIFS